MIKGMILQIAHFKIPRYVLFKKEHDFPMTATGKVKKYELRELSKIELGLQQVISDLSKFYWTKTNLYRDLIPTLYYVWM